VKEALKNTIQWIWEKRSKKYHPTILGREIKETVKDGSGKIGQGDTIQWIKETLHQITLT
jgi:hypothetical protein